MRINKQIVNVSKLKNSEISFWADKTYLQRLEGLNVLIEQMLNYTNERINLNAINIKRLHAD